jgi:hypothetical protein
MTGGLYTMLGTYYTLQSLMGAILELIIKVLVALVVIIVGLWVMPFTWPAAAATTAVFLSISIPLAIIIYFMTEVLHIKTSGIPKLRCFDKNTVFNLNNGSSKTIDKIDVNDILLDGSIVTATIIVDSKELDMYNLHGIIVSESHIIKYNDTWIPVKEHPEAIKLDSYSEPYLYCLNTSTKTIVLNNIIFTDWDEVYDDTLKTLLNYNSIKNPENISKILDKGFENDTKIKMEYNYNYKDIVSYKRIDKIKIGDILSTGGIVYGIVKLRHHSRNLGNTNNVLYNLLVSNGKFESGINVYSDYNNNIDSILELGKLLSK